MYVNLDKKDNEKKEIMYEKSKLIDNKLIILREKH
jgi:hypothetical protein